LRAPDLHERAPADQLLDDFLGDFALGDTRIEQHDVDVQQLILGDRVGRGAERHRVCDYDFRASTCSDPPTSDQQQSETAHFSPSRPQSRAMSFLYWLYSSQSDARKN